MLKPNEKFNLESDSTLLEKRSAMHNRKDFVPSTTYCFGDTSETRKNRLRNSIISTKLPGSNTLRLSLVFVLKFFLQDKQFKNEEYIEEALVQFFINHFFINSYMQMAVTKARSLH